jgi:hypothetical protein
LSAITRDEHKLDLSSVSAGTLFSAVPRQPQAALARIEIYEQVALFKRPADAYYLTGGRGY